MHGREKLENNEEANEGMDEPMNGTRRKEARREGRRKQQRQKGESSCFHMLQKIKRPLTLSIHPDKMILNNSEFIKI